MGGHAKTRPLRCAPTSAFSRSAAAIDWVHGRAAWQHRAMRVRRTFGFIDVSGFTALTELEGDERAVDVLTAVRSLLRDICSRRGVRIAKWLGDGVMLVCVETRPLVETVLEIHHVVDTVSGPVETVSIRSGITSGEVILMEGDDYIGHCVNVAARLCDLAAGGEALADPSVMSFLPSWGVANEERQVSLRGVEKPVPVSSIRMARSGEDGRRDPICGLPLDEDTADEIAHDARGSVVLFCSVGCLDTWRRRPARSPAR
jgi:class 3 adenylate cyclase